MAISIRDRDVARAQEDSARLQAISDLKSAYSHSQAVAREISNLNDLVVPTAKSAYDLMLVTFSMGKTDYFRLNEARTTYIESQKTLLTKKSDAEQNFQQLVQQVGCDFSKAEGPYACL